MRANYHYQQQRNNVQRGEGAGKGMAPGSYISILRNPLLLLSNYGATESLQAGRPGIPGVHAYASHPDTLVRSAPFNSHMYLGLDHILYLH